MKLFKPLSKLIFKSQTTAFWAFLIMLALPNAVMFFTEPQPLLTRICSIALPASLYWWALTLPAKPGKAFWWLFLFIFFDAFEIVLLYLFGQSPIAVDMFLNVVTTNMTEIDELLGNLLTAIGIVVVVYVLGIVMAVASVCNKEKLSALFRANQRKYATGAIAVSAVMTVACFFVNPGFRIQDDIFPVNVCYNLGLAVDRSVRTAHYANTSAHFAFHAKATRPDSVPEIYVVVVGETARADNFGLYGYERNTTPLLAKTPRLVVYSDAITMSNTTHKSVPMLLSSIGSEPFDSIYYRKGIITAFNEAGYKTAFYSNQRRNGSFIDFFGCEANEVKFIKDPLPMSANVYDEQLLKLVKARLDSYHGGKLMMVVHCYGSHFNYNDRYPANCARFTPDHIPAAKAKYRAKLINAYDNTISYTDRVVSQIISMVASKGVAAAVAYTSDHGEDIFDDSREKFLHASPDPTYHQLRVPLLFWTSAQYAAQHPDKCRALASHRLTPVSTNMILFHTMLDLAGITTPYAQAQYAAGSGQFKWHKRLYVNDHNEMHELNDVGLREIDVEQFKAHGVQFP